MRAALQVEAEIDVVGEIGLDAIEGKVVSADRVTRSKNEINTDERDGEYDRRPYPLTGSIHCSLLPKKLLLPRLRTFTDNRAFADLEK